MSWRHPRHQRRRDRGAAAVEFALVVPILVLLVGGIIDFGFVFSQQIALNNSARDAARAGVVTDLAGNGLTCTQIGDRVKTSLQSGAVGLASGSVVPTVERLDSGGSPVGSACSAGGNKPCTGSTVGQQLRVVATYPSKPPFPLPYMNPINLTGQGVFQCEYS
ncbi:TadE-like protein [Pedococcus cremeus]|uniref:TadE-like protein n=1 Tax=Pedococcus cremeus TaxID=587636 RepID=A0A1H9XBY2_9MICO|nr:TadE/TadG family type IV pilus assembly protein [Pedococcus cremeus]SES43680.1 TadE-like protein [Pedococcus cremeus]